MINNLGLLKRACVKFSSIIVILIYIIFLYIDVITKSLGNVHSIYLKYSVILLCLIITLLIGSDGHNKRDTFLLQLARFLTLIADYHLLLKDNYELGIFFFCLVQVTYIIRHSLMGYKSYRSIVFIIIALGLALIISLNIKTEYTNRRLIVFALVYAAFLLTSVYSACSLLRRGKYTQEASVLIALGMVLFFFCDLNVGLHTILGMSSLRTMISPRTSFFAGYLVWLFYAPSQMFLTWSGFKNLKDIW